MALLRAREPEDGGSGRGGIAVSGADTGEDRAVVAGSVVWLGGVQEVACGRE